MHGWRPSSPDATDNIKLHAGHVQIAGENTTARIQQVQDAARRVLQAPGVAESQADVLNILALSQQAIQGIDLDNDEQVAPVPGEGGVLTAYQHAQLMAGIGLSAEAATQVAAPPAAVAPQAAAAQQVAIDMVDNSFTAAKITVPVGAAVVWANTGQKKHTVTADDGSFDSGELAGGATFAHTFAAPGTYQYYCTFHGGAGGQGMSATIVVVDAAPQPAAQPAAPAVASAAAQPSEPPAASAAASQAPAPAPAAGNVDVTDRRQYLHRKGDQRSTGHHDQLEPGRTAPPYRHRRRRLVQQRNATERRNLRANVRRSRRVCLLLRVPWRPWRRGHGRRDQGRRQVRWQ